MKGLYPGPGQRGVVLLVSLLVLLLLGIIATTVARTNQLQLHMAGNDEGRIAALQQALAVVDAMLERPTGIRLDSGVGYTVCQLGSPATSCDEYTLQLAADARPEAAGLEVSVTRIAPAESRMPLLDENQASSAVYYRVAKFEVSVVYDGAPESPGRAALAQGVLVRLPVSTQSGGGEP